MIRLLVTVSLLLLLIGCSGRDEKNFPHATIETEGSLLGVHELAVNRNVPWELCWGPDDKLWFTEQEGRVCRLDTKTGKVDTLLVIPEVWFKRTAGLLGMDLFREENGTIYAFVNYTYKQDTTITSRLVRYQLQGDSLAQPTLLLEIPGYTAHNGSRVKIAHDGLVYWATGDAHVYGNAQDSTSLN
nr:PQQ-dependent sugar dehydrogenase [Flavihumibacter sp.]